MNKYNLQIACVRVELTVCHMMNLAITTLGSIEFEDLTAQSTAISYHREVSLVTIYQG